MPSTARWARGAAGHRPVPGAGLEHNDYGPALEGDRTAGREDITRPHRAGLGPPELPPGRLAAGSGLLRTLSQKESRNARS